VNKVAEGVFCEIGWEGANVGAVLGDDGFVLIDSPMLPKDARSWREQLSRASRRPILYLINTDYHFDHMMTDCLLCERVIAHDLAEESLRSQSGEVFEQLVGAFFPDIDEESRREVRELHAVAPCITFTDALALNIGSKRLEIKHMGGHTPATSIIYLPDDGILFTGDDHEDDLHPFMGEGDLLEWIEVLMRIEKMDVERIVPGHGDVCGLDSVTRLRQYFEEMTGRVRDLIGQGCGRDEVEQRVDLLSYFTVEEGKEARTEIFVKMGIARMYDQLVSAGT